MPRIIRAPKRLIDLDDIAALLVELADGHALVYDHDTGTFGLVELAAATHASRHQSGGADAIKLDDLAAPDDNTDLNATTEKHGLLPKLGGGTTNFLRADGTWAAAGGAGASFSDAEGDPADVASVAADGSSSYAARRDHVHTIGAGVVSSSMLADGAALAEILDDDGAGSLLDADLLDGYHASAFAVSGHTHEVDQRSDMFSDAEGDPAAVGAAAVDGTSTYAARRDHVHVGATADHNHDAAYSASGHTHDYAATGHNHDAAYIGVVRSPTEGNFPTLTSGGELANSAYAPSSFATAAHTHEVDQRADVFSDAEGDPAAIGTAAVDGTSTYAARRDHVHVGATADHNHDAAYSATGHTHDYAASGHNHDSAYISVIPTPTEGNFPTATSGGELANSTYGPSSFAASGHTHDYAASGHNHDAAYISVVGSPTEGNFPTLTSGGELANSVYAPSSFATSGHTHEVDQRADVFDDAEGNPADIGATADGTSTYAARRDHVHAIPSGHVTGAKQSEASRMRTINFVIDGGGAAITTGVKGDIIVDYTCTIKAWTVLADQTGSIVVDIWKDTYANFAPTDADSITASATPTLSSAAKNQDTTLTGWTTAISAGDILRFNVDSAATVQRVTVSLKVEVTA